MRPFIFLILFLAHVAFSFAQQARTSGWFFETGVSSSHYCHLDFSDKGNVYGFHAGIISNIPLAKSFAIQAGIKIQSAGGRTEIDQPMFHWESSTTHTMYLQLPVDFIYKFPVAKTYSFYTGLGPYIAKGITGKNKYDGEMGDLIGYRYSGKKTIRYRKQHESLMINYNVLFPFDYGVNVLAGFEYKRFSLYFNYGLGMKDVRPKGVHENMGKNKTLSTGIAYRFTCK